jgi:hypothetical protein
MTDVLADDFARASRRHAFVCLDRLSSSDEGIRVGEVFWYAIGCFYDWKDGSTQDVGYFVELGGLPDLMTGARGPATAHLTFVAEPFRPNALPVNDRADTFSASVEPPGQFTLYYQREPTGDFAHPESFRRGLAIATFERVSAVVGGSTGLAAMNQFTARLITSTPFDHAGHRVDLAQLLGYGVTQTGFAGAPFTPAARDATAARSFVGSAVRI